MAYTYEFVVLQVVPDPVRGERVNVGLAIFLDKGLDVRMLPSMGKVSALDGRIDLTYLKGLPGQLQDWYSSSARPDQAVEALRRLGIVTVSEKGSFTIDKAEEYEGELTELMKRLVLPVPTPIRNVQARTKIISSLKTQFKKQGILGNKQEDIYRKLVVAKFPIVSEESLYADFALKNGVFHITETADFRTEENKQQRIRIGASIAYKLIAAREAFPAGCKRYAVYAAKSDNDIAPQLQTLQKNAPDGVINLKSRADMAGYIDLLMKAATDTKQLH